MSMFLFPEFGQELLDAENHCNKLKAELQQFRKELPLLSQSADASLEGFATAQVESIKKEFVPVKGLSIYQLYKIYFLI